MPRDKLVGMERRIDAEDAYFRDLGRRWSEALASAHRAMPNPTWLNEATPTPTADPVR
jgi:putative proteasome-type protease